MNESEPIEPESNVAEGATTPGAPPVSERPAASAEGRAAPATPAGAGPGRVPRKPKSQWGGGRTVAKVLGCLAIGCGAFFLLVLAVLVAGALWVVRPGRQVPTDAIVGPDPVCVARVGALADDPGVSGALGHLTEEIAEAQRERSGRDEPAWLRRLRGPAGPTPNFFGFFLPSEATVTLERLPGDDDLHFVVAVNFRRFVRPFRKIMESHRDVGQRVEHGEHLLLQEPSGDAAMCFVGGTWIVSDDVDALRAVLDRIDALAADEPVPRPLGLPDEREGWDLAGLFHDRGGDLTRALDLLDVDGSDRAWVDTFLYEDFEDLDFGVDWETIDRMRGRFTVQTVDDLSSGEWAEELETRLAELVDSAAAEGLVLEWDLTLTGRRIAVDWSLEGLAEVLADLARDF